MVDALHLGGVEKVAAREVKELLKKGIDAKFIVLRKDFGEAKEFKKILRDVPTIYLDQRLPAIARFSFVFPPFSYFSLFHITYPFLIPLVVKSDEFDCLISHATYTTFTAFGISKSKGISYIPIIWDPISYILGKVYRHTILKHFFPILLPLGRFLDSFLVKNSLATLTTCSEHKSTLERLSKRKVNIFTPGCDPLTRVPLKRENFILSVTKWTTGKKAEFLFELLSKMPKEVKLVLAGAWNKKYLAEIKKLIEKTNFQKRVLITGSISESKLRGLYQKAKVLVLANFEAFGMGGLEASAYGCPIIIPKGSGVTQIFIDGKSGIFPKEGDKEGYLKALKRVYNDENLAVSLGKNAWKIAKEKSWNNHAQFLINFVSAELNKKFHEA